MADGYLPRSATNTDGMTYEAMLFCKTNIGGFFFDGFLTVDYTGELEITDNPVETGASIADHSFVKPVELVMQIKMSDVHRSLVPGQFSGGWSRSQSAFKVLEGIQAKRIPISVLCRFGVYENMVVKRIQANDTPDTYQALSATVTLIELPIARVKTVEISLASQTTINTEMGNLQAVDVTEKQLQSILYMLGIDFSRIGGGGTR